jgi:hypothetical protein
MYVGDGKRFVAFFDILGFGSWVESDGSKEVFNYVRGFLNLMIRSSLPGSVVHPDMTVDLIESNIGYINFSDSIVFYSQDDSYDCLKTMLKVCGEFMNIVICGPSRMIRGALAHGDFYADPESSAYVGKGLIDAYHLEEQQEWLAFSFHRSVEVLVEFERALIEYPGYIVRSLVSLHKTNEKPYCINWASKRYLNPKFNARRSLLDCYRRGLKSLRGNLHECEKLKRRIRATREFLIHYNTQDA